MAPTTILVVDDDADLREIVRATLEAEDFSVVEAGDGEAALELIRRSHPDLAILDYMMPKLDGTRVCQLLKEDLLLRHLPLIMLTGRAELTDKVHGLNVGADDYIVKPFEPQELIARVRMVLRRTAQELEANPLTKLPGNVTIQKEIESRLATHAPLAVCYCDLDQFKAFNDHYGFSRGDRAITHTAQILLQVMQECGNARDFLGHIGGDDFVLLTTPDRADTVCARIIERFDGTVQELYDESDRARGYLLHTDRQNKPIRVGFLTISIAVVTNDTQQLTHVGQIAAIGAELKGYAKQTPRSIYVRERRKPSAAEGTSGVERPGTTAND